MSNVLAEAPWKGCGNGALPVENLEFDSSGSLDSKRNLTANFRITRWRKEGQGRLC